MPEHEQQAEIARVATSFLKASDSAAHIVATHMLEFPPLADGESLPKELKKQRTTLLDNAAVASLEGSFGQLDIGVDVDACEGKKEMGKDGEVVDILQGKHGSEIGKRYSVILDPVEGTTAACSRRDGAIVIIAFSEEGGLVPTPLISDIVEGGDAEEVAYMYKLAAPPEANGVLDIAQGTQYNIDAMVRLFGSDGLNLVVMNRPANADIIAAAREAGIEPTLIESGDLLPSLAAVTGSLVDGKHVVVYGRGGDQEGRISAAAAKAVGGFMEGQAWIAGDDNNTTLPQLPIYRRDELAPGKAENTGIVFTPITKVSHWFTLQGYDNGTETLQTPESLAIVHRDVADTLSAQNSLSGSPVRILTSK